MSAYEAAGATALVVSAIEISEPADGGAALRERAQHLDRYDWIVFTSANAVRRFARVAPLPWPRIAVVGPSTAAALPNAPDFMPVRHDGEALVAEFGRGEGTVLVPRGDRARPNVVDGLRAHGWTVDDVIAYRTEVIPVDDDVAARIARADAITFTSPSTVEAFAGRPLPRVVVIGSVTAEAARASGLYVHAVAIEPTAEAMVAATVRALA